MTGVDLAVLLVLAVSGVLAFMRGLVREVLGLCAWVGAAFVAQRWAGVAEPLARRWISNVEVADPVAFGVVFLSALIVFSVVAGLVARLVRFSPLGGLDRTMGLLFGVARGAVLVAAAYIAVGLVYPVSLWPAPVLQASSLPYAYDGARWIAARVPSRFAPRVDAPPAGVSRSGDLLQAAPHGFAINRRASRADDQGAP